MVPPRSSHLVQPPSDTLFHKLATSVRGPVVRPGDREYAERSKTFNGKLKPLAILLVSPLDAHDVSAVVRFCAEHGLSLSVRAGGYGIAGWAVAGDVIIDMSMMADIDIETPQHASGSAPDATSSQSTVDWTPLQATPRTEDKGSVSVQAVQTRQAESPNRGVPPERPGKRRREDRSPSPATPEDRGSFNALGLYNPASASRATAALLLGPPLPNEPGDFPRQPPTNRPRHHSLNIDTDANSSTSDDGPPEASSADTPDVFRPKMPPLSASTRQLCGESTSSNGSSYQCSGGFGSGRSRSLTSATTAGNSPAEERSKSAMSENARKLLPHVSPGATHPVHSPASTFVQFPSMPGGQPIRVPPLALGLPPILGASVRPDAKSGHLGAMRYPKPVHPHAYVTFGAGMSQRNVDLYVSEHRLQGTDSVTGEREDSAVPYHVPMSAFPVGSSIMLLAGSGFMSRMYGLSIDNLVEVEMVLADGRIVVVNATEDPELWWAIRGAGPAFGIATRYKARAFPVTVVFAGNLIYRFRRSTAPSLIKHFRDSIKGARRELYANLLLTAGPKDQDSLVVIQMCYVGPKEDGLPYLQAISSWNGERCLLNEVNEKSFLNQQDSVAQVLRGKAGQWFLRSSLITTLPDAVINRTVMEFADTPIGCTWLFELAGGAIGDFEDTCLPKEQREATWTVAALHQWDMGVNDPRCITTAEHWMEGTIKPVSVGGPYPTFLGRHEPPARTMACYGKNWERLAELKRKYDPECLFRNNFWPLDAHGCPVEPLANEPPSP